MSSKDFQYRFHLISEYLKFTDFGSIQVILESLVESALTSDHSERQNELFWFSIRSLTGTVKPPFPTKISVLEKKIRIKKAVNPLLKPITDTLNTMKASNFYHVFSPLKIDGIYDDMDNSSDAIKSQLDDLEKLAIKYLHID